MFWYLYILSVSYGEGFYSKKKQQQAGFAEPHSISTIGWCSVGLRLGLGLGWGWDGVGMGLGWGWVGVGLWLGCGFTIHLVGWVGGWVGDEVRIYNHSSAQPTGFYNRSECGNNGEYHTNSQSLAARVRLALRLAK